MKKNNGNIIKNIVNKQPKEIEKDKNVRIRTFESTMTADDDPIKKLSYQDQMRHPLWQKKRLEIMQRDKFSCQFCRSTSKELNVHHINYKTGAQIWDYEPSDLITLCSYCHGRLHQITNLYHFHIINIIKHSGFDAINYLSQFIGQSFWKQEINNSHNIPINRIDDEEVPF